MKGLSSTRGLALVAAVVAAALSPFGVHADEQVLPNDEQPVTVATAGAYSVACSVPMVRGVYFQGSLTVAAFGDCTTTDPSGVYGFVVAGMARQYVYWGYHWEDTDGPELPLEPSDHSSPAKAGLGLAEFAAPPFSWTPRPAGGHYNGVVYVYGRVCGWSATVPETCATSYMPVEDSLANITSITIHN